jgi:hypothetical protein
VLADTSAAHYRGGRIIRVDMTLRTFARRSRLGFATALALLGACRDMPLAPARPDLPAGAEALTPLPTYADWWRATEQCAGLQGDLSRVSWFVVPGRTWFTYRDAQYDGYWWNGVHWIILAGEKVQNAMVVRHEMLHELLGRGDHPAEYFQERCAGLVVCNETCRSDE